MSESNRLKALHATKLLDTETEERFDRIVRLASGAFGTDVALVSFIDKDRQWFKSKHGLNIDQTPRDQAFCHHAIQNQSEVMVVLDAERDERFACNPLVTGDPNISFYAGAPLVTKDGYALGTLCVIDSEPRETFSKAEQQTLLDLAATVMTEVELANQNQINSDLTIINEELQHRMGNMYAHISALVSMLGRTDVDKDQLVRRIRAKITSLSQTQALLATRDYKCVSISELLNAALSPFRTGQNQERFVVQSKDEFEVSARGAFILTLMINELGTNAIKHGALKTKSGHIQFSWSLGDEIKLNWTESGVPCEKNAQVKTGFGTQILNKIVPMDLQGIAFYELTHDGLHYSVTANPSRIAFLA